MTDEVVSSEIIEIVSLQFKLPLDSFHGVNHWERVFVIGQRLSRLTGADLAVVSLFAYLHDSQRKNEDHDSEHGARAAVFAQRLWESEHLAANEDQLKKLIFACRYHMGGTIDMTDDITIHTCWDADRLDLWRVGIAPDPELLCTDAGKQWESIHWAKSLSVIGENL